jgi:phosphatidylethanolamine-binding protein (PEBP) family uncharacterized protein
MQLRHFRIIFALTCISLLSACSRDGRDMQEPSADQQESIAVTTTAGAEITPVGGFALTPTWAEGAQLDARFTCSAGVSPGLTFQNVASDIVTLALSIVDETANNSVQWIVANIEPTWQRAQCQLERLRQPTHWAPLVLPPLVRLLGRPTLIA